MPRFRRYTTIAVRMLALCCLLLPPQLMAEEHELPLLVPDLPPSERTLDPDFFVQLIQLLQAQISHRVLQGSAEPVSRLLQRLEAGEDACVLGLLRSPQRDQFAQFVPVAPLLPMQAVIRKNEQSALVGSPEDWPISIQTLLDNPDRHGVLIERVYTPALQQALSDAQATVEFIGGAASSQRVLAMLERQRGDFTLEFPAVLQRHYPIAQQQPFISVPLQEARELIELGLYCPRSTWGSYSADALMQASAQLAREPAAIIRLVKQAHGRYLHTDDLAQVKRYFAARRQTPAD